MWEYQWMVIFSTSIEYFSFNFTHCSNLFYPHYFFFVKQQLQKKKEPWTRQSLEDCTRVYIVILLIDLTKSTNGKVSLRLQQLDWCRRQTINFVMHAGTYWMSKLLLFSVYPKPSKHNIYWKHTERLQAIRNAALVETSIMLHTKCNCNETTYA